MTNNSTQKQDNYKINKNLKTSLIYFNSFKDAHYLIIRNKKRNTYNMVR